MADLIVFSPDHGFSDDDQVYVSWLDSIRFISDKAADTYKLATALGGSTLEQFSESITNGFVRLISETEITTITGLEHLEGETVKVTSAGSVVGTEVVSDGSITLSTGVFTYQVGLSYKMKVRTMRLSIPQEGTTVQGRIKRINGTNVRFLRSLLGNAGQEYGGIEYLQPIEATFSVDAQDTPPNNRAAQGGFSEEAYITVTSDEPVPFTVLATITDVEVEK